MTRLVCWLAACLAMGVATAPAGRAPAPTPSATSRPIATDRYDRAAAYLRQHMARARIPGLAVAVVQGDRVTRQWTWGVTGDGAPVDARTPFLLGSVSKPVTALAVLQLAESGRVDLDAPVRRYLPWLRLADDSAAQRITVRQLLTHSSGLPGIATRGLTDRFDNAPDALTRAVRDLAAVRPIAAPGAGHEYSDANYLVLAALVEAVTGRTFGAYLRRNVLDPLEMTGTATTADEARAVGLPAGHRYVLGRPHRFESPFDTSGVPYGYLTSSLDGLTHFAIAQLNGGRYRTATLLSPTGVALAQRGQVEVRPGHRYGLGWRDSTLADSDVRLVWHAGATPGYFSHLVLAPESGLGVVLLANVYSPARDDALAAAAFNVVRILLGGDPVPAPGHALFTGTLAGLLAVAGVLLVALVVSLARMPLRVRAAARGGRRRLLLGTAGWVAGSALLAVAAGYTLPAAFDGAGLPQVLLWTPDLGWTIVAVVALAAALALARIGCAGWALFRLRAAAPRRTHDQPTG